MSPEARQALEAILFVVDEPVDVSTLSQVLEVGRAEVEEALDSLEQELREQRRGFVLREAAGGWRLYTAPDAAPYLERWVLSGRSARLSQAALETLAVVAYRQPITRSEISEIRGVDAHGAVRTLVARGFVEEVGRDDGPGQAIFYGTTREFLEKLGIGDVGDLPELTDFLPEGPAPDEPAPGDLREARARLQRGTELASTGRARWDPMAETDTRSEREREMDDLTDALEEAARSAMDTLDAAMRAASDEDGDEAADGSTGVDDDGRDPANRRAAGRDGPT